MQLIKFNSGMKAIDQPLHGRDWIIRFDGGVEITIRAYRDPSDSYTLRRARALLREVGLDQVYRLGEVSVTSELFLEGGLQPARSIMAILKKIRD